MLDNSEDAGDQIVTKSLSRPHVSNDNPFSEAQLKTLKYCPSFPERFGSIQDARSFCRQISPWYNEEHRHSGIGYYTPATINFGRAHDYYQIRAHALDEAYIKHPERIVRKPPKPTKVPSEVWISPPKPEMEDQNKYYSLFV